MKKLALYILFLGLVGIPGIVLAKISVDLNLDRSQATLSDTVRLAVSVSGVRNTRSAPEIQGLESFSVTQGGTSSRIEMVNGKVNSHIDYTFYIQPRKTGTFRIGPARITVQGKSYQSGHTTLSVAQPTLAQGQDRGALFLTAQISAPKVYVDQQTLYIVKFYRRANVRDISINLPENDHLAFKQLGEPREYESVYNGKKYRVLEIRYALVATAAGSYAVDPSRMNMTVFDSRGRGSRGVFDDPFFNDPFFSFSRGRPLTLASEPAALQVMALPEDNKPADFSGLVGKFSMKSELQPLSVKAGESATLTVKVTGQGNVQRIPDLKLPQPDHVKLYADQPVLEVKQGTAGTMGTKTMKWALVPEKEGDLVLAPLTLSYFDPQTHAYQTEKIAPPVLKVLPGEKQVVQPAPSTADSQKPAAASKQQIKEIGRDILPVHTSVKELTSSSALEPGIWVFAVIISSPLCLYLAALFGTRVKRIRLQDKAAINAKKAFKNFTRSVQQGPSSTEAFINAVRIYLNDRCTLSLGAITSEEVSGYLEGRGVKPETVEKLRSHLQGLEMAVYSGKGHESTHATAPLVDIIRQVDRELA